MKKDLCSIRADWVALEETKLRSVDSYFVQQICGQKNWGFVFSASIGAARGILYCWDKEVFVVSDCAVEQRFVAVKGQ